MRIKSTRYRFKHPEEIFDLARQLTASLPVGKDIMPGIYELLLNAVEHGNLALDNALKPSLLRQGLFVEEITRRLALPENVDKCVEIELVENNYFSLLTISDQGNGFDWEQCLNTMPALRALHGRGLLIAARCGFDSLIFNTSGNMVTCLLKDQAALQAMCFGTGDAQHHLL